MQSLEERLARLEQEFFTNGGGVRNLDLMSFLMWDLVNIIK